MIEAQVNCVLFGSVGAYLFQFSKQDKTGKKSLCTTINTCGFHHINNSYKRLSWGAVELETVLM